MRGPSSSDRSFRALMANMAGRTVKKYILLAMVSVSLFGFFYQYSSTPTSCFTKPGITEYSGPERVVVTSESGRDEFTYGRNTPLIFIGGMPRSGTTLLRVLLDAHPDIRCGEETRVVPRMLGFRQQWMKAPFESRRLKEAGITSDVLDSAISSFILEIIARHGPPAKRLCNKDPFTLRSAVYLKQLFPSSKFIFMIRDGRAVVHSIITRKVTISGFDLKDFRQCMKKWNSAMESMHSQCQQLGPTSCLPVHYEQLVLSPRVWLEKILNFLQVSWNDSVLHHEELVNVPGGISLSKLERSTDQVIKPINLEALSKWVGQIPADVVSEMAQIAPMLATLGYDPDANPPEYGKPDSFVVKKMNEIKEKASVWKEKEKELLKIRESIRQNILQDKNSPVVEVPADNPSDNEIAPDSSAANSKSAPGTS